MSGWIGVDLDGTLAHYDGWKGEKHIGKPIKLMLERVQKWLKDGREVKIFTARVCMGDPETVKLIEDWCEREIGVRLPVTNQKDYGMVELWDDRCVQVMPNTGIRVEDRSLGFRMTPAQDSDT